MTITHDDSIVNYLRISDLFLARFTHPRNKLLVFVNKENENLYKADLVSAGRIILKTSAVPEDRILNLSHQSLITSPHNPLFGKGKPYSKCIELNTKLLTRETCKNTKNLYYGAWVDSSNVPITTLTYNPHFNFLTRKLTDFLREEPE